MKTDAAGYVYHAWLASATLQPQIISNLLKEYRIPENIWRAVVSGNVPKNLITPAGFNTLKRNASDEWIEKMKQLLVHHDIRAFTMMDEIYPSSLQQMQAPPAILFYQGDLQCLERKNLAMVGSRAASYDGQKASGRIARDLSRKGIGIISGMAGGIDSASHSGCIEGGSPTIAVTGCGLDIVYPSINIRLRDNILEHGGLLISEYAPGEKPVGWHFPFRNRIITGLAKALIVIEAKIRSGTMTSVQHALDQGKDIFVYPGDPASPFFEGNHLLLREGAQYFTTAMDILEDLGWLDNPEIIGQNSGCSGRAIKPSTPEEETVLSALSPGKLSFEQIAERCDLAPATLLSTLTMLQIKGAIEALPGKLYQINDSKS